MFVLAGGAGFLAGLNRSVGWMMFFVSGVFLCLLLGLFFSFFLLFLTPPVPRTCRLCLVSLFNFIYYLFDIDTCILLIRWIVKAMFFVFYNPRRWKMIVFSLFFSSITFGIPRTLAF